MNTKLLMGTSAIFMGLIGLSLTFIPAEVLEITGQSFNQASELSLQLTGALYFGFAMVNWMAKTVLIGGIYSKPLSMGNFSHFLIAGLALVRVSLNANSSSNYIFAMTFIYVVFAICFGYVAFTHPDKKPA